MVSFSLLRYTSFMFKAIRREAPDNVTVWSRDSVWTSSNKKPSQQPALLGLKISFNTPVLDILWEAVLPAAVGSGSHHGPGLRAMPVGRMASFSVAQPVLRYPSRARHLRKERVVVLADCHDELGHFRVL